MTAIVFIGKPTISDSERDLLDLLGQAFAHDGVTIITKAIGEANQAIAQGARKRNGTVSTVPNPLTAPAQGFLLYADTPLLELLDANAPGWRAKDPTIVLSDTSPTGDFELYEYVTAALAGIAQQELTTP